MYHYLEERNPDDAKAIRAFVINYLKNVSDRYDYNARFEELAERYGTEDVDVIESEMTANAMFEVLNSEETIKRLAGENPTLLEKIRDALVAFIEELKGIVKKLAWDERTALDEEFEILDTIRFMFNNALEKVDTKNTALKDGEVKYSLGISHEDIKKLRSVGRKSINEFTSKEIQISEKWAQKFWSELGDKSPFFRSWFGDWRAYDRTAVTVATKNGSNRGNVKNRDTNWDIKVSGKVFNESRHNGNINKDAIPYLSIIEDVIKNAILLDTFVIDKAKSVNSLFMHSFYTVADIGDGVELLKLYVEEMNNPNTNDTSKRAYQLQNIEKQQLKVQGSPMVSPIIQTAVVNTVSDLFSLVKHHDKNFNPNKVNEHFLSKQGFPIKYYHGTNADFSVFDRAKSSKKVHLNVLGDGNYFTSNKTSAERYGKNVIGAYIKIKTPYIFKSEIFNTVADQISEDFSINRNSIKGSQVQAFLKSKGFDGVISLDEDGRAAVVNAFDSNQVKSFEDIIGTFDGNNPDIRYSYAGQKAVTANRSKLGEAISLENAGELSAEEIRKQTGWFRGYDNKWRFEIDDSKMKVSTSGKYSRNPDIRRYQELTEKIYFEDNATDEEHAEFNSLSKSLEGVSVRPQKLGDLIEHDELFAAYPQLENISFRLEKDTGSANGWYSEFDNEIVVRQNLALKPEELKSTLIHEIQHAIQHIENFANGSNPEFFEYNENAKYETLAYKKYVKAENRLKAYMQYSLEDISDIIGVYNSETVYLGLTQSEYAKAYDKAAKQIKDENLLDVFWEYAEAREELYTELSNTENETPRDSYRKTAGEIEARDVQKRLNYNSESRKNIRPDIDRTDVVFAEGVDESYEIKIDSDGNKFVDVDPTLFDARSGESHAQTIARIIKERFDNLLDIRGQKIQINKTTNDEWRHSKSANYLMKLDIQSYNDKLKTIPFADEIVTIAKNWIGEEISHTRSDDIVEFARGNVYYRVEKNGYVADIIVGTRKNGSAVLYDIKNIYTKKITDAPVTMASKNSQRSAGTSVNNSVSQTDDDVKIKYSLQETADASKTRAELLRENDNLRVANKVCQLHSAEKRAEEQPRKDAGKIARQMLREFNSKYDSKELTDSIYNIFQYYAAEGDNTDYVIDYLATVAKDVVAQSQSLDSTLYEDYADLRKTICNMKFALPEHVLRQLEENHDGKFRQKTFGKMRLVSKSVALNQRKRKIDKFHRKFVDFGAPEGTRTPDLLVRSQSLYPTELPAHAFLSA